MASSKITKQKTGVLREIQVQYSIAGNSTYNANLKTLIDADMPSGYQFGGLGGFSSNNVNVVINNCGYHDSAYSLQMWNRSSTATGSQIARIFYIAQPM